mmetsp:Transcript_13466/g.36269  ORF Transcript_13466/g.36269 Transcript_13466/m.36269 type:complete len:694 (+) Transcript_13466:423-2504(+)
MQVRARSAPLQLLVNRAQALHAVASVVEVAILHRNLPVHRQEKLFAGLHILGDVLPSRGLFVEPTQLVVTTVHHLNHVRVPLEDDLGGRWGLQDAAPRLHVGKHLHLVGVDLRVEDHPSSAAQLPARGDVNRHRVFVIDKRVDDHRTILEDLGKHVARASREPAPVGEDDEWQILASVEVTDGLSGLEGGVREPHLASLRLLDVMGLDVRRVGRDVTDHRPRLHGNDADWKAAHAPSAHHHGLAPTHHVLLERALVTEPCHELAVDLSSRQHVTRVVWGLGRHELDLAIDAVCRLNDRGKACVRVGDVGEPPKNRLDAVLVVVHKLVRDAVGHHDVRAAQLVLCRVHVLTQEFVDGLKPGEDHGAFHHLDVSLPKAIQVSADANAAPCHIGQGERFLVGAARLTRNEATPLQVLDTDAALRGRKVQAHNGVQHMPRLPSDLHLVGRHGVWREIGEVVRFQVKVIEALVRIGRIGPSHLDQLFQLLDCPKARARVARDVDPRNAHRPRHCRGLLKHLVLGDAEGSRLDRQIVADEDHGATTRVLWRPQGAAPHDHADVVLAVRPLHMFKLARLVQRVLLGDENLVRHRLGLRVEPDFRQGEAEERQEVVNVRRSFLAGDLSLVMQNSVNGRGPDHLPRAWRKFHPTVRGLLLGHCLPTGNARSRQQQRDRRGSDPDLQLDRFHPKLEKCGTMGR